MRCVLGIDLGSTTTKAVMLDESGVTLGRGITNSRSNYEVACAVARIEAHTAARFDMLDRALGQTDPARAWLSPLRDAFRLELFLDDLASLEHAIEAQLARSSRPDAAALRDAVGRVVSVVRRDASALFLAGAPRRSDFFRDLAGAAFVTEAEALARVGAVAFEPLVALYDRAIIEVETSLKPRDTRDLLGRAVVQVGTLSGDAAIAASLAQAVGSATAEPIEEVAVVGTGYGRQTLPFPREAVRSEILCHGRGAHRVFPGTRTVLDIGGQDTKAIQIDDRGVVTSFQMNDRCAAGCGRYLGYIADELGLGLHELGPLALQAKKPIKVNSTCTVFAGAELRERLSLGQRREDILAGLHRAIMLRAMSLLARSGGVKDEFTFTGGVCNNSMATKILRELVDENYGAEVTLNIQSESIYMGALGAAMFALDDLRSGTFAPPPAFVRAAQLEVTS
ncbi:MAG: benzoyl-CoA reductase subunit A [Myxococcales bacterium]|nr:benzoyl-CoA reductase subunit A [Myxococcales bacterium]MBL0193277.1 benzoyl-CoA reductase subunit A [Myxococcales bacterium]HQY63010.1 BadF/BadG/BcrA/BcrD ATPase family protein [Polyangiaceae bacterium]